MRTNYVLIDYENMQPAALSVLEGEHFRVIVFVGAKQSKVTFDIAASLQRLGPNASYIKIAGNGSNALDFHIAYYIGQIAAVEPNAYFHIISKDAGFADGEGRLDYALRHQGFLLSARIAAATRRLRRLMRQGADSGDR